MRRKFSKCIIAIAASIVAVGGVRTIYTNHSQMIELHPLPLITAKKAPIKIGRLVFLRAWELGSGNMNFGGISALVALNDSRFVGISDAGTMIGFGLSADEKVNRPFIAALPGAYGAHIGYLDRDSEGATFDPETGRIWVSYEGKPAIRRFTPSLSRVDGISRPAALRTWEGNRSAESIARLPDGRFLLFSEEQLRADGNLDALLFPRDPVDDSDGAIHFGYRPPAGYLPTDATSLPDGRVLILHRQLSFPEGFAAKLVLFDPAEIEQGKAVRGQTIATIRPPYLIDNMEGLTLTLEQGRIIVWMVSDNNFNIFQRTLLMKFALDLPMKKPDAERTAPGFDSL